MISVGGNVVKPVRLIPVWAVVMIALLVTGWSPVLGKEESVGPKAVFQTTRILVEDPVLQGNRLEGVFEVTNEGDEVLEIVKVSPG